MSSFLTRPPLTPTLSPWESESRLCPLCGVPSPIRIRLADADIQSGKFAKASLRGRGTG